MGWASVIGNGAAGPVVLLQAVLAAVFALLHRPSAWKSAGA
jgi:hypothetical protein